MQPLHVLIVIDSLAMGGAERCAVDFACALDRSRWEPHVLVTRHGGPLEEVLRRGGVEYTVLGRRRRIDLRAVRRLRRWIGWADVVHAHKLGSGAWCSLLRPRRGAPLIVHEHNWSGGPGIVRRLVYRWLIRRVAWRTIAVSASVARTLAQDGVPPERIVTLPNAVRSGVALPRDEARRQLGLDPAAPVIGMVAGLRPEKAHEVAIEALADPRLRARGARLCIVGDGPRAAALESIARDFGVSDRIDWRPGVPDQAIPGEALPVSAGAALAAAFDVAVVCSDWEGLPLFALESLIAGTPLVATSVGELPHLLRLDAGWLVPTRDAAALAAALDDALSGSASSRRCAERGLRRAEAEHAFSTLAEQLDALYAGACSRHAPTELDAAERDRAA